MRITVKTEAELLQLDVLREAIRLLREENEALKTQLALERRRHALDLQLLRNPHALTSQEPITRPIVAAILTDILCEWNISEQALLGRSRTEQHVQPRHALFYLVKSLTNFTNHQIGILFAREISTVGYAIRAARDRLSIDPIFAARVARIQANVSQINSVL